MSFSLASSLVSRPFFLEKPVKPFLHENWVNQNPSPPPPSSLPPSSSSPLQKSWASLGPWPFPPTLQDASTSGLGPGRYYWGLPRPTPRG